MLPTGEKIPDYLKTGLDRYAADHIPTGGFLRAVLNNDLFAAFARADSTGALVLHDIVGYCYNEIPAECWGSPERVQAWLAVLPPNDMPDDPESYYNFRAEERFDYGRDR